MADAIISLLAERVAAILVDKTPYEINLVRRVKEELLDLPEKLKKIREVLNDAQKRAMKDQSVKSWLKELENTAYVMDDILDEWNYSLLKHKHKMEASADKTEASAQQKVCRSFIPSSCLCFKKKVVRHRIAMKIENVKAKLDEILRKKDGFNFFISVPATDDMPKSWKTQSTYLSELKKDHGVDIERKKSEIVRKLMLNGGDTQILSIVGMGGIGKTTLARLVYNDTQVQGCFDLRIWICVSDPFDVAGVARGIVNSVGKETIPPNTNQLELVLQKLRDSVSGKKFLLVLDDVWTEDYNKWEPLKINLKYGAPGSKILVTTRNEKVTKMMGTLDEDIYRPKQLSDEECWSLLRRISLSGRSEEKCGEFDDVGKKIAGKCKGLPLAANVLGRLLQFKTSLEEWEDVEKSEIWQLKNAKVELFPHLVLSYNELSPALKRCFSYCAVYPKHSRINTDTLIEEWMALGYLGSVSGNGEVELKGRECLNNLAMRCLFQDIEESELGEQIEWCKMHDIVHDFALFVRKNDEREEAAEMRKRSCQVCDPLLVSRAQEYRRLFWDKRSAPALCDCLTSVRVLRIENRPPPVESLIHLRWLDCSCIALSKESLEIICRLYFLQTLSLTRCDLTEIPLEIGNLLQLRRLDLSWNEKLKELPESMCSLIELRSLSLARCSLEELRGEIGNLIQLRRLELSGNVFLKELPESVFSLVELRTLSLAWCSLREIPREIGNLVQLRRLDLSGNRELKELPESMYSLVELRSLSLARCSLKEIRRQIGNLIQLRRLDLSGNRELKELSESICSLVELQILKIEGTSVHRLPEAIGQLSNLRTLALREFKVGSDYKKLGLLKKLNRLTASLHLGIFFSSMSEMVELVEDAREAPLRILLQKLEKLKISFEGTMNEKEQPSSSSSSSVWVEVLEALEPHRDLKELAIWRYKGSMLPHWMSSPHNLIKEIRLHCLSEVSSLPAMGKLPLLEVLYIDHLKELKLVGWEFLGIESSSHDVVVAAFPKLKELTFDSCPEWEEWEDITEEEEKEFAAISIMPCLTELSINFCKSLKKLPHRLLHKASSSLRLLDIEESPELVKTYGEDKEGSPWRSISQHNPQLVLDV